MDGRSFDDLARRLGRITTRRTALKTLLGGAVAAATGAAIVTSDADAAHGVTCNPAQARCAHHADCCSGLCETQIVRRGRQKVRVGRCGLALLPAGASCTEDSQCASGACYHNFCLDTCGVQYAPCDSDADCCSPWICDTFWGRCDTVK